MQWDRSITDNGHFGTGKRFADRIKGLRLRIHYVQRLFYIHNNLYLDLPMQSVNCGEVFVTLWGCCISTV